MERTIRLSVDYTQDCEPDTVIAWMQLSGDASTEEEAEHLMTSNMSAIKEKMVAAGAIDGSFHTSGIGIRPQTKEVFTPLVPKEIETNGLLEILPNGSILTNTRSEILDDKEQQLYALGTVCDGYPIPRKP